MKIDIKIFLVIVFFLINNTKINSQTDTKIWINMMSDLTIKYGFSETTFLMNFVMPPIFNDGKFIKWSNTWYDYRNSEWDSKFYEFDDVYFNFQIPIYDENFNFLYLSQHKLKDPNSFYFDPGGIIFEEDELHPIQNTLNECSLLIEGYPQNEILNNKEYYTILEEDYIRRTVIPLKILAGQIKANNKLIRNENVCLSELLSSFIEDISTYMLSARYELTKKKQLDVFYLQPQYNSLMGTQKISLSDLYSDTDLDTKISPINNIPKEIDWNKLTNEIDNVLDIIDTGIDIIKPFNNFYYKSKSKNVKSQFDRNVDLYEAGKAIYITTKYLAPGLRKLFLK